MKLNQFFSLTYYPRNNQAEMRFALTLLTLIAFSVRAAPSPVGVVSSSSPCELFLALDGDDFASGACALRSAGGCGPLASFAAAHAAAEAAASPTRGGCSHVVVHVGGGVWRGPWHFPRLPSGVSVGRITYRGAVDGLPTTITGGVTVAGFLPGPGGTWTAAAPPELLQAPHPPAQLFVGGARRPRARAPNVPGDDPGDPAAAFSSNGTFEWASPLCPSCAPSDRVNGGGLVWAAGDVDASWPGLTAGGAEVLVFSSPWSTCAERVAGAFDANRTLLFGSRCFYALGSFGTYDTGRRWLLENVHALLDAPGEWLFDAAAKEVLYIPMPHEAAAGPAGFEVILPVNTSLVVIERDGLTLEDVRVAHWALDPAGRVGAGFASTGAVEVAAIDVALRNVSVAHGGSNCVLLHPGVARVAVTGCALTDCGGNGVYMATQDNASDVLVADCTITGVGLVYLSQPTGILLNGGSGVSAVHNAVVNSTYTGISVAWMHGAAVPPNPVVPPAYRFNISFNRVASFGLGVLSDFGGVRVAINNGDECFVNGTCYVPTLVANNVISHGRHFSYGADGIYTDNAVAGVDVVDNLVYDVLGAGLHLHAGMNLTARNNLIYGQQCATTGGCASQFASKAQGMINGATKWPVPLPNGSTAYINQPFAVNATLNVVVAAACSLFAPIGVWPNAGTQYPGAAANSTFDNNVYWNTTGGTLTFPLGLTLDTWRAASGCDTHSVAADPLIADAEGGNFTLLPASPALARGFRQIDTSQVGPRRCQ